MKFSVWQPLYNWHAVLKEGSVELMKLIHNFHQNIILYLWPRQSSKLRWVLLLRQNGHWGYRWRLRSWKLKNLHSVSAPLVPSTHWVTLFYQKWWYSSRTHIFLCKKNVRFLKHCITIQYICEKKWNSDSIEE